MSIFGGLLGGKKHPNWDRVSCAIRDAIGLTVATPSVDVLQVIDGLSSRELVHFENTQSVEGMQELFRAKSIQALVDLNLRTVALFVLPPEEIERELQSEHTVIRVMSLAPKSARSTVVLTDAPRDATQVAQPAVAADSPKPVAAGFEHLEAMERLCPAVVDLFVRHGQLTTGDKDVLKKIQPVDATVEARIVALERWQTEVARRLRAITPPKAVRHIAVATASASGDEPSWTRRFDALLVWMGKLIKSFEATGVRFHTKPVWLPR